MAAASTRAASAASPRCPACGRETGAHRTGLGCPLCTGPQAADDALRWSGTSDEAARRALRGVVVGQAHTGSARDLVSALKFRRRLSAASLLAGPLTTAIVAARVPGDLLVPVPLSRRRRRERKDSPFSPVLCQRPGPRYVQHPMRPLHKR